MYIFSLVSIKAPYCVQYFCFRVFSDSLPDFAGVDVSSPNCVVLGDSQHEFTYDNLNKAFRVLMGLDKPILFALGGGLVTALLLSINDLR